MRIQNIPKIRFIDFNESSFRYHNELAIKDNTVFNNLLKLLGDFFSKITQLLTQVKEKSSILYRISALILLVGIGCFIGLFVDDRTLMGVNIWVKPLKFSISIAIYLLTLGYLITKYPYSNRKKLIINHITAWTLLFEFAIIAYQGARGVQSHYNATTNFDAILFLLMGVMVVINTVILFVFIFDTIRLKLDTTKAMQWAILLGLIIFFLGSWVGGQMINQVGHNVGVADGGAGLPIVNWSTKGGDLRVAHFFALHGLQIIPLFALWISKKRSFSSRNQIITVTVFALLFASLIGYIFYQAKQGIPITTL